MNNEIFKSSNKKHLAKLLNVGEIRFGPAYFELELDGVKIKDRLFSSNPIWSKNEQYIALQEWVSIKESEGPKMQLCLFDLNNNLNYTSKPIKGYAVPKLFEGNILLYNKADWSSGSEIITELELHINEITTWK